MPGAVCPPLQFTAAAGELPLAPAAGGDEVDLPRDNLDLERWLRPPKGHEQRIHRRYHAGVWIVQEGPALVLALDAHQ